MTTRSAAGPGSDGRVLAPGVGVWSRLWASRRPLTTPRAAAEAVWRARAAWVTRQLVAPLAGAAFFLGWVEGESLLAGREFSGLQVVALAGTLAGLDLSPWQSATLVAARAVTILVAVAAAWHGVMAPFTVTHPAYRWSGVYLASVGLVLLGISAAQRGVGTPAPGALALATAGAIFVASSAIRRGTRGAPD